MRNLRLIPLLALVLLVALPVAATQVGDFMLTFDGVSYEFTDAANGIGTSTWTYTLLWQKSVQNSPALSHLTIEFCDEANVIGATPPEFSVGVDGSTGLSGIKWDQTIPENTPVTFSFTLDRPYIVDPNGVQFSAKAGTLRNIGSIEGPSMNCEIARPSISLDKSCTPAVFVGDSIPYVLTITNDGNVPLENVTLSDTLLGLDESLGTLGAGATREVVASLAAEAPGTVLNTASVSGDFYNISVSATSSCESSIYELNVAKTAETSFERDHDWNVSKSTSAVELEICSQTSDTVPYTIEAIRSTTDREWMVSGDISIANPAPIAAHIVSVSDVLDGQVLAVNCGVTFPFDLPAGQELRCTYSAELNNGSSRINTAAATLNNGTSFTGSASVEFLTPTRELDATITVADAGTCPDGFICTTAGPFLFSSSGTVNYEISLTNVEAMCDSWYSYENVASWSDDEVTSTSSASVSIYTCGCSQGCTLTIGYWKTHAGFTGRNEDRVSQYLSLWLGTPFGPESVQVTTAAEAVDLLSKSGQASNGINKLYAQLLAAKLNIANGASFGDIASVMAEADTFLAANDSGVWSSLKKPQKAEVLTWMTLLDGYNNGDLGPGHCD